MDLQTCFNILKGYYLRMFLIYSKIIIIKVEESTGHLSYFWTRDFFTTFLIFSLVAFCDIDHWPTTEYLISTNL